MTTCIPFQKDHGNYRCTTCAWASTIVIGTYHWCVGLLPMPSKINAPEDQKPSNNEINAFDPGRVAKEEQKKARAKVISTTAEEQQQWDDWHWYQDRGFQEHRYEHPTGRYYGDRRGPYPSHGSSSSSSRPQRWEGWYGGTR